MKQLRMRWYVFLALLLLQSASCLRAQDAPKPYEGPWPPALPGAVNGTVTITTDDFIKVPAEVQALIAKEGAMKFTVAGKAPTVDLAFHGDLPNAALNGTGWSAWGDILVASDGKVYSATGDHGDDKGGKSNSFIYVWDPATKGLKQIVDLNTLVKREPGDPTWAKVHARILEGKDKKIYFTGTLNDGGRSFEYKWTERVPGGQIFQYDPATGKTQIIGHFPGEVMATTLMDQERNIFYGHGEGKTGPKDVALTAFDLTQGKIIYQSPHDAVVADRNMMLARNGMIYFNGKDGIWKYDPNTKTIAPTKSTFPGGSSMRSSTHESKQGWIYGTTYGTAAGPAQFFRYAPAQDKLEMLGPDFGLGEYTTVTDMSPDERFVYYLPGAHGGAMDIGTPVVQYNIATGQFKVLAFLREGIEKATGYTPAGTYGMKVSADGSTLYVDFNGQPKDGVKGHGKAFGLTAFAAIHIPAEER